jgi:hypothetical protein
LSFKEGGIWDAAAEHKGAARFPPTLPGAIEAGLRMISLNQAAAILAAFIMLPCSAPGIRRPAFMQGV